MCNLARPLFTCALNPPPAGGRVKGYKHLKVNVVRYADDRSPLKQGIPYVADFLYGHPHSRGEYFLRSS